MSESISGLEPMARVLQDAAGATGNGNNMELNGRYATAILQVTDTFVGTVTFEVSNDGTNFVAILAAPVTTDTGATTITATGMVRINVKGCMLLRARVSAWTSGTITVKGVAVPA